MQPNEIFDAFVMLCRVRGQEQPWSDLASLREARSGHGWYKSAIVCVQCCMDGEEAIVFFKTNMYSKGIIEKYTYC